MGAPYRPLREVTVDPRRAARREALRTLHPGYFALVMATGIVSVGLRSLGVPAVSVPLLWLAGAAYAVLVVLNGWRLVSFPAEMRRDLSHPVRGFGFFTFVAGTNVLGSRLILDGHVPAAVALLAAGALAWFLLGYVVLWNVVLGGAREGMLAGANGTWFIWIVASQSVALLAAQLQPAVTTGQRELALLAVFSWSVGLLWYGVVGTLVTARLLLYQVRPADLTPPYWVAMGATAISVLAGARMVQMADAPVVEATRGLIAGTVVVFWALGTWLIPALLAAGWWRHVLRRVPLRYEATWWSIVFPVGMYGVASIALGEADQLPIVATIGEYEMWVAAGVWLAVFITMFAHLARTLRREPAGRTSPAGA